MRHGIVIMGIVTAAHFRCCALLAAGALVIAAGCAPMSTYPPVETKAQASLTKATYEPVPTVMAAALRYADEHYANDRDMAINLPPGAGWEAYDKVIDKLGWGRPMTDPAEPAFHIKEVRTRMMDAQVDMVYPKASGLNQLVTLTLRRSVTENYHVKSTRPWQLRDVELPEPHYVPPTPEEQAKRDKKRGKDGDGDTATAAAPEPSRP